MDLANLRKTWDSFAENDPLWAVLSWSGKEGGRWTPEEFFAIGQGEVSYILEQVGNRQPMSAKRKALDFGCGVGRLTFPLGDKFEEVHGVDISRQMVATAERFKADMRRDNCHFHVNHRDDLALFQDSFFDLLVSIIVLQHMEPTYALNYIREFVRVLAPGGICVFQYPDETENRADYENFDENGTPIMEMYGMPETDVRMEIATVGGDVLEVIEDQSCGPELRSLRYFVTKRWP